ncbi:histidine kinase [Spirillospora sp. NPDC049652]
MERSSDAPSPWPVCGMLWASLGILFATRAAAGFDNGWGPPGVLLATTSYPPLIALLALRRGPAVRYALLACLVLLYLVPFPVLGWQWEWAPWTVAAGVLCGLPTRWAWPTFTLVVAATGLRALLGGGAAEAAFRMIVVADDGLVVFGVAALVGTVVRLSAAREELARLALARERLRLDGELRDVLGGRLQAIAFRMRRAVREDAPPARQDIREATELARRTLADLRARAAAYRAGPLPGNPTPVGSPRLARRVLLAVLIIQCVLVLTNILVYEDLGLSRIGPLKLTLAVVGLVAVVILQLLPQSRAVFLAQALLLVLPIFAVHLTWDRLLSFLTGSILLRVRRPYSWALVGVVLAAHLALLRHEEAESLPNNLAAIGGHVTLMWLVYALGRLDALAAVLERARHDLAETAVRRERTRIARDLHDVLGYSLSAVALKGELAERLLDTAPERAGAELASLGPMAERAIAELDAIVVDRVELTLTAEIDAVRRMLEFAGVETIVDVGSRPPSARIDTALAVVLRESVTNVLRHSQAGTCEITISESEGAVRLRVRNDGAVTPGRTGGARNMPTAAAGPGSGLANLAQRTGGRLTAGHRPGDRFEVVAEFRSDPVGLRRDPDGVDPVPSAQLGDR